MTMRAWIFQANPKLYDIDGALRDLDEIWWRVPQYTSEIHRGDVVILWRSGSEAGVVGVGRVISEPRQHQSADYESKYVLEPDIAGLETRALVHVRPTEFVPKSKVAAIGGFEDHLIVIAPRGSVFTVEDQQYESLKPLLAEPPDLPTSTKQTDIPPPFAWEQRSKSTHPMPGGYDGYLKSLDAIARRIRDEKPTRSELADLVASEFEVSPTRSNLLSSFLHKAGFVIDRGEIVGVSEPIEEWLESGNHRIPVALLHSRVRFIGEMLEAAIEPKTTGEMLDVANQVFGCNWSTKAQIDRRRGWLQSAGMIEVDESNRLITTSSGRELLNELVVFRPNWVNTDPVPNVVSEEPPPSEQAGVAKQVEEVALLADELVASSVDSSKADRFERAVRDAFGWLGFEAEWLGGSGKTDVLLDAPLGLNRSYRVIVDCKTSASGSVGDTQVDWITLREHKKKHDADYVAVVAPAPSGKRLFERAAEQGVTLIAVDELVTLCEQHAIAPLDLESYRTLFESGGLVSTDTAAEKAEDWLHVVELARLIIDTIALRSEKFSPLDAGGLQLLLADDPTAEPASIDDFQAILDTFSGPLVSVLVGNARDGYYLTTTAAVAKFRLETLGRKLFGERRFEDET